MRSPLGLTTVLLLALAASAGCVGTLTPVDDQGGDDGGGTVSVARQMFTDDVTPLLNAVCAGCHVGAAGTSPLKFLGAGGIDGYYSALTGSPTVIGGFVPSQAMLLQKGEHQGARAWTTAEADTITMWMIAEADERAP